MGRHGVEIHDLAVDDLGTLYVLDAADRAVVRFDSAGAVLTRWGGRGSGPGEFTDPTAIALAPGGEVYVLDAGRISIFDGDGRHLRTIAIPFNGRSIAVPEQQRPMVADWVYSGNATPRPYVVQIDEATRHRTTLLHFAGEHMLGERPFIAPAHTRLAVAAGPDGRAAAWYFYDAFISLFRHGRRVGTVTGCISVNVIESYNRQVQHGNRSYQQAIRQIAGVWLDRSGDVYFLTPDRAARKGYLHRYSETGEPLAVYEFAYPPGLALRSRATFVNGPERFISWDGMPGATGDLDVWQLSSLHAPAEIQR